MENYNKIWRLFYALCMMAIGVQQLMCGGFRPVILPPWPVWLTGCTACVWIGSFVLILASAAIALNIRARQVSVYLGAVLLLLLVIFHIPYQIKTDPHFIAGWSDAFKIMALAGGAFVTALSIPKTDPSQNLIDNALEKLLPAGRFMFATTMIVFGTIHFIYIPFVAMLVPAWIPGHLFCAYFGGIALIVAGIAIVLNIQLRLAATLLGAMIFIWFVTLHIPRAIADPHSGNGNEWTSVFEALGFSGIAFLIASVHGRREQRQ